MLVDYESGMRGIVDVRWHSRVARDEFRIRGVEGELDLTPLNGPAIVFPGGAEELPAHANLHFPCVKNFVQAGVPCLGIEPAANVAQAAEAQGVPTRVEFFGEATAVTLVEEGLAADLILGNNVFAHAPFINDFVTGLKRLLKEARLSGWLPDLAADFPDAVAQTRNDLAHGAYALDPWHTLHIVRTVGQMIGTIFTAPADAERSPR